MAIWEPEETVGHIWHRLVGDQASYPRHPEATVALTEVRATLGLIFRAMGGSGAVQLSAAGRETGGHRLSWTQRLGMSAEWVEHTRFDGATLTLPEQIGLFPERADNVALYEWLAAFFAHAPEPQALPADPLQRDLVHLRHAHRATAATLAAWPGLRPLYARLCQAHRTLRPRRRLPGQEVAVEFVIAVLTGDDVRSDPDLLSAVKNEEMSLDRFSATAGYRPFLPVPLWGEIAPSPAAELSAEGEEDTGKGSEADGKRRKARRRASDQTRRDDPLMLNRFETILGLAEMVNLNRKVEDDDAENARKAAEVLDEIALGQHERKVATKLKMELDLTPAEAETGPLRAELTYPEWDWKRRAYHPDHCRVVAEPAAAEGEDWRPDDAALKRIRLIRRQFEALRPRRQILPAQSDGDELDLSALVRSLADRRAGGPGSDRVYAAVRNVARDLSVCVLMDVSMSTDSYVENRRVIDVEKEALLALAHGLTACGDEYAILTFTSRKRHWVGVRTVKDFEERPSEAVIRRIQALKPGSYTRMGAAIRHARSRLDARSHRQRLLLLITDGKPNDTDYYEGRYAIEDTRMAVQEVRRSGIKVFGATIDEKGREYVPYIFGPGAFAILPDIARLPLALPAIYRQMTQ